MRDGLSYLLKPIFFHIMSVVHFLLLPFRSTMVPELSKSTVDASSQYDPPENPELSFSNLSDASS